MSKISLNYLCLFALLLKRVFLPFVSLLLIDRVEMATACWTCMVSNSSVKFRCSGVSDSLWPHESQHARSPCPSLTPGVHSNSCPSSWWCDPAISSSVVPFFSCLQSLPASESSVMSQLSVWGGQSIGVGISFRMGWLDLLAIQGTLKSLLQHHSSKASILWC